MLHNTDLCLIRLLIILEEEPHALREKIKDGGPPNASIHVSEIKISYYVHYIDEYDRSQCCPSKGSLHEKR